MMESADYMLAKIIELQKDIDKSELFLDIYLYIAIISVVVIAIIIAHEIALKRKGFVANELENVLLSICIVVLISMLMFYGTSYFDLHFMYEQMNGLVIAYENVYGPLPEGIL